MCPGCITTVVLTAGGSTSAAGLAALVARKVRQGKGKKKAPSD